MKDVDPFDNQDLKQLQLYIYLTPVVGFFPSLWTLYCRNGDRDKQAASRLSVTLALGWLFGYILLGAWADNSESLKLPLLLMNSLLTSGYFVVSVWLMISLWQRQPLRLPIVSRIANRLLRKYLS